MPSPKRDMLATKTPSPRLCPIKETNWYDTRKWSHSRYHSGGWRRSERVGMHFRNRLPPKIFTYVYCRGGAHVSLTWPRLNRITRERRSSIPMTARAVDRSSAHHRRPRANTNPSELRFRRKFRVFYGPLPAQFIASAAPLFNGRLAYSATATTTAT
ncbi:hypothetical protein EVAR_9337_1 [Eumeta japonica]|uniref:Uncharacterized protein n=1 Tax=Eumeta variegata TaxID=151549 RepID=A0A4C1YPD6_EUMVA|nr:hypothetical protein EVAR_9337_1 [Eumeta japonica]